MSKDPTTVSAFWWVNQGETYEEAKPLGTLWSPLENKRSGTEWHWDSMESASVGDVVFHYSNGYLRGVSKILVESRKAAITIRGSGQWGEFGRELRVDLTEFDYPIALEELPISLRVGHESKTAPFDANGKVKQGYFFPLPTDVAVKILELANLYAPSVELTSNLDVSDDDRELEPLFFANTDGTIQSTVRKEQSSLRDGLFKGKKTIACGICGNEFPSEFIHAAHIKKRSVCSHEERLDRNVVMPACLFGCDALFERGLITVDDDGLIASGKASQLTDELILSIDARVGKLAVSFNEKNAKYFKWHRNFHLAR